MSLPSRLRFLQRGLSVALLCAIIWWISPASIVQALRHLTLPLLGYLLLISAALIYVSVMKWQALLAVQGRTEGVWKLFLLYLVGYFVNLIFPSFIGGDAVRSWYLGKSHGQREAAAATFLERYSGLFAMIALGAIFMWCSDIISAEVRGTILIIAVVFSICSFLLLHRGTVRSLSLVPRIGRKLESQGALFQEALRLGVRCPKTILLVVAYSFLFHCIAVVNTLVCAHAVGWSGVPLSELFVVLPVILLLGAVPITPQGLGIQEGAFVYYLTQIGATSAEAFGIALIIRVKTYILALFGGLCWLALQRQGQQESCPESSLEAGP